ncbi:MAG: hypothetical protein R3E12_04745 [Candidatus Eisenbacteria bacterium]
MTYSPAWTCFRDPGNADSSIGESQPSHEYKTTDPDGDHSGSHFEPPPS